VSSTGLSEACVRLTGANIKSKHIYITAARNFLPKDVYGGSNKDDPAERLLTVKFEPGQTVQTDIPEGRNFLRDRGAVADFLARTGARVGDEVRIALTAPYTLHVSLVRAAK
jgi:hypothetical protein